MTENNLYERALALYNLTPEQTTLVPSHEGGRNQVYALKVGNQSYVLRLSGLGDRTKEDYLAETEFVHYLVENGAPVAKVLPSLNGNYVEQLTDNGKPIFVSLFTYAEGMLISDNGYRYREGAPLSEYFYNTGKTLGILHRLAKSYTPKHKRQDYFDKYNMDYIGKLIPDDYLPLKNAISERLEAFKNLPQTPEDYGMVHFDFSDGNYHINMTNGKITVFDFDNCMTCWYLFDLANLWTHGVGWCAYNEDKTFRKTYMQSYFAEILNGYTGETPLSQDLLNQLPLFIDMVLIENLVDEFECCAREHELPDKDDIEEIADCLIHHIPYAGFC